MNTLDYMNAEKQIETIQEVLKQHLLPDCLKPKYDGMTLWSLSNIILMELSKMEEKVQSPKDEPDYYEERPERETNDIKEDKT